MRTSVCSLSLEGPTLYRMQSGVHNDVPLSRHYLLLTNTVGLTIDNSKLSIIYGLTTSLMSDARNCI